MCIIRTCIIVFFFEELGLERADFAVAAVDNVANLARPVWQHTGTVGIQSLFFAVWVRVLGRRYIKLFAVVGNLARTQTPPVFALALLARHLWRRCARRVSVLLLLLRLRMGMFFLRWRTKF